MKGETEDVEKRRVEDLGDVEKQKSSVSTAEDRIEEGEEEEEEDPSLILPIWLAGALIFFYIIIVTSIVWLFDEEPEDSAGEGHLISHSSQK